MGALELFFIAIGLSMDAFAVSICHGLSMEKANFKKALIIGLYFGIFQAVMPLIGYIAGSQFASLIDKYDHWVAFILLACIGVKMIIESQKRDEDTDGCGNKSGSVGCSLKSEEASLEPKKMIPLAFATSVDALAVGISFAFIDVKIMPAVTLIGITTLTLSMIGVKIGNLFGAKFKSKAELAGGIILVIIGFKILLDHFKF